MNPGSMMGIGSVLSALLGGLTGNNAKTGSTYSKNQRRNIDEIIQDVKGLKSGAQDITQNPNYMQGQDWLSSLFNDEGFFNKFEAPAFRQFNEEIIPGIANRFASMGSGGSLGSTAFRNQANRAGVDLATNLAAMRGGMQQQGVNQGMQYAQQPFQNYMNLQNLALTPTRNTYQGPSQGMFGALAAPFAQGAASYWGGQGGMNQQQSSPPWSNYASMAAGQYPGTY